MCVWSLFLLSPSPPGFFLVKTHTHTHARIPPNRYLSHTCTCSLTRFSRHSGLRSMRTERTCSTRYTALSSLGSALLLLLLVWCYCWLLLLWPLNFNSLCICTRVFRNKNVCTQKWRAPECVLCILNEREWARGGRQAGKQADRRSSTQSTHKTNGEDYNAKKFEDQKLFLKPVEFLPCAD